MSNPIRSGVLLLALFAVLPAKAEMAAVVPEAKRIAAIGGSVTEIIYALGEQKRLIARDSTSIYPPEAMSLPDVGYMRQLSPEGVLSANPDAILLLEGSGPPEALDVIRKASVPVVSVPERFTHEGVVAKIRAVGDAIGASEKANKLAADVDNDLKAAEKIAQSAKEKKRVLFILSLQGGKILASGTGTAANGVLELAGAENVMASYPGYKQVTDEAVLQAQPDVILMMDRGGDHGASEAELFAHPAIAGTPAAKNKKLIRMDGVYLLGFGPRTAGAVRDLAEQLAKS